MLKANFVGEPRRYHFISSQFNSENIVIHYDPNTRFSDFRIHDKYITQFNFFGIEDT